MAEDLLAKHLNDKDPAQSLDADLRAAAARPVVEAHPVGFSRYYTLAELTATSHGPNPIAGCLRYGARITEDEVRDNLRALCKDVLDPVNDVYGKEKRITLSSCYRGPLVNVAVGGSNNSAHTAGLAADTQPAQAAAVVAFFARNWKQANLDRIIFERRGATEWLHVQRLQRDAPAHDPKDAKFFLSPSADTYQPIKLEALMALLIAVSKRRPA